MHPVTETPTCRYFQLHIDVAKQSTFLMISQLDWRKMKEGLIQKKNHLKYQNLFYVHRTWCLTYLHNALPSLRLTGFIEENINGWRWEKDSRLRDITWNIKIYIIFIEHNVWLTSTKHCQTWNEQVLLETT